jgi:hypothetical protein
LLAGARERPRRRAWLVAACHYRARALGRLAGEAGGPAGAGASAAISAAVALIHARIGTLSGQAPVGPTQEGAVQAAVVPGGAADMRVDAGLLLLRRIATLLERLGEG